MSKTIVRLRMHVPSWARPLDAHITELTTHFRDDLDFWCYEDQWNRGQAPTRLRRAGLAVHLYLTRYARVQRIVCAVQGHTWVDDDPGNPEVGPQPCVYCTRCGEQ